MRALHRCDDLSTLGVSDRRDTRRGCVQRLQLPKLRRDPKLTLKSIDVGEGGQAGWGRGGVNECSLTCESVAVSLRVRRNSSRNANDSQSQVTRRGVDMRVTHGRNESLDTHFALDSRTGREQTRERRETA